MSTVIPSPILEPSKEEKKLSEERQISENTDGLKKILQAALLDKNPLVRQALAEERALRQRTQEELGALLEGLKESVSESEYDTKTMRDITLAKLETDLELVKKLNDALTSYKPSPQDKEGEQIARFPLKFNKMEPALQGALRLFLTPENFNLLSQGKTPSGYSFTTEPRDITILGEHPDTIYGSSKGTFLKTAALTMYLSYSGKVKLYDLNLKPKGPYVNWIDNSSMVHTASLPVGLELDQLDNRFSHQFTYSYKKGFDRRVVYVHQGYTFGDGLRGEQNSYPQGKAFAPKDCSSWIEAICDVPEPLSTLDLLYYYRTKTNTGAVSPSWSQSSMVNSMDMFEVVKIKDPQTDIRPGQVLSTRSFNLNIEPKQEDFLDGVGGHTGVVLGFNSQGGDSQVAILSYNRDMPKWEGLGVQQVPFPLFPKPVVKNDVPTSTKVMIFSVNGKAAENASLLPSLTGDQQNLSISNLNDKKNRKKNNRN